MERCTLKLELIHTESLNTQDADTQRRVFFHLPVSIQLVCSVRSTETAVFVGQESTLNDSSGEATVYRYWVCSQS